MTDPDHDSSRTITKKQTQAGWETGEPVVAGVTLTTAVGGPGTVEINYYADEAKVYIGGIEVPTQVGS